MTNAPLNDTASDGRRVCSECIGEAYLAEMIARKGTTAPCHYCTKIGKTISIDELSARVRIAITEHYYCTMDFDEQRGKLLSELVAHLLGAGDSIVDNVRKILIERNLDSDFSPSGKWISLGDTERYEESPLMERFAAHEAYERFAAILIEQARYFSSEARDFLGGLFDHLEGLRTHDGRPVLVDAGPGQSMAGVFRARVFQDKDLLKEAMVSPDLKLGPPPSRTGRAGRLNAAGVAIFYGADAAEVALAEVRPPVGSRVLVGCFELLQPVRLLDIDALQSLLVEGSVFDPGRTRRRQRATFLASLSERFTRPVMPDHEAFEYIPTQAVADYLANEIRLDGILYASPQSAIAGRNVALFHRSSLVEKRKESGHVSSHVCAGLQPTGDGYEIEYSVHQTVFGSRQELDPFVEPSDPMSWDTRKPTLRIDETSLQVHHIHGVEVRSDAYPVHILREMHDPDTDY